MDSSTSSASSSTPTPPRLTSRLAKWSDVDELRRMRRACGWGEEQVLGRVARTELGQECLFLFYLEGGDTPIGMASIELEDSKEDDTRLANRETHVVLISALFIYSQYQSQNIGNQIMSALESYAANQLEATICTVFTKALDDGDPPRESRNVLWYRRRGYTELMPCEMRYGKMLAAFLKKDVRHLREGGQNALTSHAADGHRDV